MKAISCTFTHDYDSYIPECCDYALREANDGLAETYSLGFLPYSGKKNIRDIFYGARSARVDLKKFFLSSENRRIAKKFDGKLFRKIIPLKDFDIHDKNFLDFCTHYFKERHGPNVMPEERLRTILDMGLVSDIAIYTDADEEVVAYVLEVRDSTLTHFWFSFYDLAYANQSLGMWLMLDHIRKAKKDSKRYSYIGTVYGERALYKTNLPSLEYWSGSEWINDIRKLKSLARNEDTCPLGKVA